MSEEPDTMEPDTIAASAPAAADPGVLSQHGVDDDLRLRSRDQHPPVDEELEGAERPPLEHVLQRFALLPTLHHQPPVMV